jgi:transglutaminase-like putative cysteine protease
MDDAALPIEGPPTDADLIATATIDHDDARVRAWALETTAGATDDAQRARLLFAEVRDRIRYDATVGMDRTLSFTASETLQAQRSWCVPKSVLLAAGARAVGIPARLGFADVRNHLSTPKLLERMGTDLFVFHGYTVLFVDGAWRKASPAFNAELCERFGVPALDFDGRADALLHPFDGDGRRHMEYVNDRGMWTGVPVEEMFAAFKETYGWRN